MPGSSDRGALKRRTARQRADLWKRVGAFVRVRREELGLSQGEIIRVLGYKSRNAVSNIADVLELSRDAFFRFVTGEADRMEAPKAAARPEGGERIPAVEAALRATYRKLPPKYQRRLREQAEEFETLARAGKRR